MKNLNKFIINKNSSFAEALKKISVNGIRELLVVDNNLKFEGIISEGDIRKKLLKNINLDKFILKAINVNPKYLYKTEISLTKIHKIFSKNIFLIPIIDKKKKLIDVIVKYENLSRFLLNYNQNQIIIMSGGLGTRLYPFTKIMPKALIPVGDSTLLKKILLKFTENNFYNISICVRHQKNLIKNYIKNLNEYFQIKFIEEKKRLGTIGALRLINYSNDEPVIIVNCDTYINYNYQKILKNHKKSNAAMTIVVSKNQHKLNYGICEIDHKNFLTAFKEKPLISFFENIGFYIINKNLISLIPRNQYYDIDKFISKVLLNKFKINTYAINENKYYDFGQWESLNKSLDKIK